MMNSDSNISNRRRCNFLQMPLGRRSYSSPACSYCNLHLFLTLFIVLIIPSSVSSENFFWCQSQCTKSQQSFNDERDCERTCEQCPKSVCDPGVDRNTYHCPSADFNWDFYSNKSFEAGFVINIVIYCVVGGFLLLVIIGVVVCCIISKRRQARVVQPYYAPQQGTMMQQQSFATMQPGTFQPGTTGATTNAPQQQTFTNNGQWSNPFPYANSTSAAINPGNNG